MNFECPTAWFLRGLIASWQLTFMKRAVHLEVRRNLKQIEQTLIENGHPVGPTTLDALLGFTAGQMVIRPDIAEMPYVYLGLYQSIVRNSIPLFVRREYYEKKIAKYFKSNTTVEALIVGCPIRCHEISKRFNFFLKE